jgi:hypothetical protein
MGKMEKNQRKSKTSSIFLLRIPSGIPAPIPDMIEKSCRFRENYIFGEWTWG